MVGNLDSAADPQPVDQNLIVKGLLAPVVIRQILSLHEQQLRDCAAEPSTPVAVHCELLID